MMEKDKSIINLINIIKNNYIENKSIQIVDYWSADLCAIGIIINNILIYINTFTNKKHKYYFEIENNVIDTSILPKIINKGYLDSIEELITIINNEITTGQEPYV